MQHVFNLALLPILKGAVDKKLLISIPSVEMLLETAHILPSKDDKPSAVIARFYTRNLRSLIFQLKKDHVPRLPTTKQPIVAQPGAKPSVGKYAYPIYEDLTVRTKYRFLDVIAIKNSLAIIYICFKMHFLKYVEI